MPGRWNDVDYEELFLRAARGDFAVSGEAAVPAEATCPTSAPPPRILCADPHLPEADPAGWIFYTSGTTSDPKGALHSDATLLASAVGLVKDGSDL